MGTKSNPAQNDCYSRAEPDEPMFTLLARDPQAPDLVRDWADRRVTALDWSVPLTDEDRAQIDEALAVADAMEAWRRENRP